jgi:ABC-2 type transport system permease protein
MHSEVAVQPSGWTERVPRFSFLRETAAVTQGEVRKLLHDPVEILGRVIQPTVWIVIFAPVFSSFHMLKGSNLRYIDYIVPGILAQSVLFISVIYGVGLLWERDLGLLQKFLVSPASRGALVLGKAIASGLRNLPQIVIVYALATFATVKMRWNPLSLLAVVVLVILGSALFCMISMLVACIMKNRERFLGVNQLLTAPLFFASNALYPLTLMPWWLRRICIFNPLTYIVDGLRGCMLAKGQSTYGLWLDFLIPIPMIAVLVLLTAWFYPRVEY